MSRRKTRKKKKEKYCKGNFASHSNLDPVIFYDLKKILLVVIKHQNSHSKFLLPSCPSCHVVIASTYEVVVFSSLLTGGPG